MSEHWFMLTLVGHDRPGIVAKVTKALFEGGCYLGEASMMRIGESFTIMMMVRSTNRVEGLMAVLEPVAEALGLEVHIDPIEGRRHQHLQPDVRVTVFGADRMGIVAEVTGVLADAGLNILELESSVAGTEDKPIYVMQIEGQALRGVAALEVALEAVTRGGIEATLEPIDTMVG